MDRSKVILYSIAGVTAVLVLAFCYLAFSSSSKAAEAVESRDRVVASIRKIYRDSTPFPSRENARAVRSNMERLASVRSELTNALASRNIPRRDLTPSFFVQKLQKLATLKEANAPIVDGGRVIDEKFTFGFERYIGQNPSMPKEDEVPRLFQQLVVVDELIDALYAAKVSRIVGITREVFETGEVPAEARRGRGRAPARRQAPAARQGQNSSQHFSVTFRARQEAAVAFLNNLAKLKYFFFVTDVSFRKVKEDVRLPGMKDDDASFGGSSGRAGRSSRKSSRGSRANRLAAENEESAEGAAGPTLSTLPPGQRLMSGAGIDNTLEVVVDFDVYAFGGKGK